MKSLKGNIGEERGGGAMLATKKGSEKWARKKTFPFFSQRKEGREGSLAPWGKRKEKKRWKWLM